MHSNELTVRKTLVSRERLACLVTWTLLVGCAKETEDARTASIEIVSPASGAATNSLLQIVATSKGVVPDKVELLEGETVLGTVSQPPYNFTWDATRAAEGPHTLVVEAISGSLNWRSAPVTFQVDRTDPSVASTVPASGATNVDVTSPIQLTFSEPMDSSSVQASLTATVGSSPLTLTAQSSDGKTFSLSPGSSTRGSISVVVAGAKDLAGNPMAAITWTWTAPNFLELPSLPVADVSRTVAMAPDQSSAFVVTIDSSDLNVRAFKLSDDGNSWADLGTPLKVFGWATAAAGRDGSLWIVGLNLLGTPERTNVTGYAVARWDGQWTLLPNPTTDLVSLMNQGPDGAFTKISAATDGHGRMAVMPSVGEAEVWSSGQWTHLHHYDTTSSSSLLPWSSFFLSDGSLVAVEPAISNHYDLARWSGPTLSTVATWANNTIPSSFEVSFASNNESLYAFEESTSGDGVVGENFDGTNWADDEGAPGVAQAVTNLKLYVRPSGETVLAYGYEDSGHKFGLSRFSGKWTTLGDVYCPAYGCGLLSDHRGRPVLANWGAPTYRVNE